MQHRGNQQDEHQHRYEGEHERDPLPVGDGARCDRLGRALGREHKPSQHITGDPEPTHQGRQHQDDADDRHVPAEARGEAAGNAGDDPVLPASPERASSGMAQ